MIFSISQKANKNYLCKIVEINHLRKHSNADRLQIACIDFYDVIVDISIKQGDLCVYFPVESRIDSDFLSFTNSFRNKILNKDKSKSGFFEETGRVKIVKIRGENSAGHLVPIGLIESWAGEKINDYQSLINTEFDTVNNYIIVRKFLIENPKPVNSIAGRKPNISRLIDGQVHFHVNTKDIRKNVDDFNLTDLISITYKSHGTSWWVSNVLVKKPVSLLDRLLNFFHFDCIDTYYDIVYGSRNTVKNKYLDNNKAESNYFKYDLWSGIKDKIKHKLPKGYTLYGECLGYTKDGNYIQNRYDYGCGKGEFILQVYRITFTNKDGIVADLSYPQIEEFCFKSNLVPVHLFFYGTVREFLDLKYVKFEDTENWRNDFIKSLESEYTEKNCFMCNNKVPEEGIVIKKESLFNVGYYKLRSFRFLEQETNELDRQVIKLKNSTIKS